MSAAHLDSISVLKERSQTALIQFLHIDLDLAFTFLQTAKIEAGSDPDHSKAALDKARTALDTIRQFQGRVEDATEWRKIQDRANSLESAIKAMTKE